MQALFRNTAALILSMAILLFCLPPAIFVWLADPCHVFHKPFHWLPHGFSVASRCQNAGLINSYLANTEEGFDAVMTGTSLSLNFTGEELSKYTGVNRTLKLILTGARPLEQKVMMERALSLGRVKRVFWEVFPQQYIFHAKDSMEKLLQSSEFPAYLYNNGRIDDYRYVFNMSSLQWSLDVLSKAEGVNAPSIDTIAYWDDDCPLARACRSFRNEEEMEAIRKFFPSQQRRQRTDAEIVALDFSRIDQWLLPTTLAYCNSDVLFDLYIPPLSYWWFTTQSEQDFDFQLYALRHLLQQTAHCRNVQVHAFNDVEWIAGDLAHYRDPRHFYGDVHHYIMESLGNGTHRVTLENVAQYELRFIEAINRYQPWASTQEQMRQHARY